jgi:cobalt/nickel transport system permease protein
MGILAAFIFAAQMINFTIPGTGSSGHLGGGMLLAILLGPHAGFLAMASVLTVQALFFADGGLSALGLSIINMGLIGAVLGYGIYRIVLRFTVRRPGGVALAAGIAAFVSVPLAAMGFVLEFAIGGTADISTSTVFTAMLGTHILIGIGEGILTGLVVGAVMSSRPDLVYGAPDYTGARTEELV